MIDDEVETARTKRGEDELNLNRSRFNQTLSGTVASFRRLAALDVETACFGHGEPIESGAADRIREVAATLVP